MALIEVEDLHKAYAQDAPVLRGASLTLERGEVVSIVGASGAGKSTLLAVLAGLLLPDTGEVRFAGDRLTALDEAGRARLRAGRIGAVLQADNLIGFLTATENVALAIELAGGANASGRARELLGRLGLGHRLDDYPRRLSGGEAQRAALAVALANNPDLLLADEVTAELDTVTASRVLDLILEAAGERGAAVLLVTHSPELAQRAGRIVRLVDGRVTPA